MENSTTIMISRLLPFLPVSYIAVSLKDSDIFIDKFQPVQFLGISVSVFDFFVITMVCMTALSIYHYFQVFSALESAYLAQNNEDELEPLLLFPNYPDQTFPKPAHRFFASVFDKFISWIIPFAAICIVGFKSLMVDSLALLILSSLCILLSGIFLLWNFHHCNRWVYKYVFAETRTDLFRIGFAWIRRNLRELCIIAVTGMAILLNTTIYFCESIFPFNPPYSLVISDYYPSSTGSPGPNLIIEHKRFRHLLLTNSSLANTVIKDSVLENCVFVGVDAHNAVFRNVVFRDCLFLQSRLPDNYCNPLCVK